jgi:uncharacterized protein (TIGR01777 family)
VKVAVTGASGLIGSAVVRSLLADGHAVVAMVRRPATGEGEAQWDPQGGTVETEKLEGLDALVHFAGAGIGDRRWTASHKREVRESRVLGTRTIARAIASLDPRPSVMVSGSAIGYYGHTGETPVDETSPVGDGFFASVVRDWEAAAAPARDAGIRVVHPRSGLVVARHGGAWGRMWPLFRLGLGGKLGDGHQYWSFVSLRDEVLAIRRMMTDSQLTGAYNVTAPNPATNEDITKAMGNLLHRPTVATVPAFVLKTVLGELSSEVLGSVRVLPSRLTEAGFEFQDPTIEQALEAAWSSPN